MSDTFLPILPVTNKGGILKNTPRKFLMKRHLTNKEQAIGYFLGTLSEREQNEVEERFFADEAFSRFLDSAEDDLIDDYICGKLDSKKTQNFESRYLISKRRRDKVRSAQILQNEKFTEKRNSGSAVAANLSLRQRIENLFRVPNAALTGGLAAILFLVSLGGLWLTDSPENDQTAKIENKGQTPITEAANQSLFSTVSPMPRTDQYLPPRKANQKRIFNGENLKPAKKLNSEKRRVKTDSNSILAVSLPVPNPETPLIIEAGDTKNIRLRVAHNDEQKFVSYRVEIRAADGDLLWSREIAADGKNPQKTLALNVRRGALVGSNNYELTISGATADRQLEEINFYSFIVQ